MGKGVRADMMSKANELLQELSAKIILNNQGKIRFTATEAYALVEKNTQRDSRHTPDRNDNGA